MNEVLKIIEEEVVKCGLPLLEQDVKVLTKMLIEKAIPRIASESSNATVKVVATGAAILLSSIEPMILAAEDKIDGVQGN